MEELERKLCGGTSYVINIKGLGFVDCFGRTKNCTQRHEMKAGNGQARTDTGRAERRILLHEIWKEEREGEGEEKG